MWLGLESSCDESALALVSREGKIIGEWLLSQVDKHAEYGGVVPDLAVGEHLNNFVPLLQLASEKIELSSVVANIAVTRGPGLVGCLAMGISFAKTLGALWKVPVHGVNHLTGHALSVFMPLFQKGETGWEDHLPHLGLLVSGGNTLLFKLDLERKIHVLANTVDDAAGEALDKGAKLMGIPYPGGAKLEEFARNGDPQAFDFPRSFPEKEQRKFSFSGIKTSLFYRIHHWDEDAINNQRSDLCASYQQAVVDQLTRKTRQLLLADKYKSFGLSGGVANNDLLRSQLRDICRDEEITFLPAEKRHTGDNAAMIGFASFLAPEHALLDSSHNLSFNPSLRLGF